MKKTTVKQVSNQIGIEVLMRYQPEYSNPQNDKFLFAYKIKITNQSKVTVQLLNRKWFIFDSTGKQTIVEGEGGIGKTPILKQGETFEYVSCCPLDMNLRRLIRVSILSLPFQNLNWSVQIF